jgi:hypothetical protein
MRPISRAVPDVDDAALTDDASAAASGVLPTRRAFDPVFAANLAAT